MTRRVQASAPFPSLQPSLQVARRGLPSHHPLRIRALPLHVTEPVVCGPVAVAQVVILAVPNPWIDNSE